MSALPRSLLPLLILPLAISTLAQEDTSERTRAVSDNLAAALADTMPKYNPPPPRPEKPEEDPIDQPKNGIIRLPTVVVRGERPPIFTEREVSTDKGLKELAVKRYYSGVGAALNSPNIPFFGAIAEKTAIQMWEEDERLRHMADFEERAAMESALGDDEKSQETRRLILETTARNEVVLPSALNRETKGN